VQRRPAGQAVISVSAAFLDRGAQVLADALLRNRLLFSWITKAMANAACAMSSACP
jgi:hypothetical protein